MITAQNIGGILLLSVPFLLLYGMWVSDLGWKRASLLFLLVFGVGTFCAACLIVGTQLLFD